MKKLLLVSALMLSFSAMAGEGNNGNAYGLEKGNTNENTNVNINPSSSVSDSYSSSYSGGSYSNSFSSGGVGFGEGGNAAALGGSSFNSLNVNYEASPAKTRQEIENRGKIKNTPDVDAPALATGGNEVCMGSTSVGGSGPGVGVSFGSTWTDENCNMRRNAAMLHNMGHAKTANVLMCADAKIAAAFAASGEFVCPPAPAQTVATSNVDYR